MKPTTPSDIVKVSRGCRLLFLSKAAMGRLTVDEFRELRIENVISLEEMSKMFPHLGPQWDGSREDAVALIAGMLRYSAVYGPFSDQIIAKRPLLELRISEKPARLWWITQYYVPENVKRRREIQKCLEINKKNPLIDKIILLNEKEFPLDGVEQRVIGHRLTYADVLKEIAGFPDDVIVAFANSDICIDDWKQLWSVNLENKFLALLRYDVPESGQIAEATLFGPRADSQDTWVVLAKDVKARGDAILKNMDFPFGKMGCDNAVALEMMRQKFAVVNPAFSLRTFHFHASDVRTYNKNDVIDRPIFLYVQPSGFHDLMPVLNFSNMSSSNAANAKATSPAAILRSVRGPGAAEWLMQVNKTLEIGQTPWKLNAINPLTPFPETILTLTNCFQTSEGLVFDKKYMYIGSNATAQKKWGTATVHSMTPSIESKKCVIVPWPGGVVNREIYVLKYLSKVLRIWTEGAEFFCPEDKFIVDALESFKWNAESLPVIKHEADVHVWCREAVAFTIPEIDCILPEDIRALRENVKGWSAVTKTFGQRLRLVIVEDGEVFTESFVRELEEVLEKAWDVKVVFPGRTSASRMCDVFCGAWGVICGGGGGRTAGEATGWNWLLPEGGKVFEISKGKGSQGLELSSAANLDHIFVRLNTEEICNEIWKEEEKLALSTGDENLPIIWMPRRDIDGYFGHPGDSFREMVRLWARAGLCRVKEHASATMVWWGEVGAKGVLLYDRPNHDWRLAAPLTEKEWRLALFGNPNAKSCAKGKPWFFWPRRPEFVEELVCGAASASFAERREGLVFYGKTENKVQARRRENADWESACKPGEWVMVKGNEQYPFTQKEYLVRLSKARFGLCLAGYGLKCHREIECMAMGCVPLCAPDVDMDSYADPPIEGTHYLRIVEPGDAARLCAMSAEEWSRMSAAGRDWWARNASCAGSFALTKRLVETGV